MTPRLMQAALLLVLAGACGAAPSRPAAAASERPFSMSEVARFDRPWAMDFLPGSGVRLTAMALVTEKGGALWLVDTGSGARQPVAGVPAVHVEGQGGLADVVAHPGFAGNQRIYLSFPQRRPDGTSGATVGYGRLILGQGQPRIEGFRTIWNQAPTVDGGGHYAERLAFAPDGTLFISSGERMQFDPAQDKRTTLGKIVRITDEGGIPADNPFHVPNANSPNANSLVKPDIWSLGHRNPLGLAFAPDGRLWSTEMGPRGGDELNLIVRAENYGWPRASYGSHYDGRDIPDDHAGRGFAEPKVWWNPSISPGGLLIYSGDLFKGWKGDAIIPALSGEALIRVDIAGEIARKADHWPMGARIRAVDQGPRGELYLLEDGDGGRLRLEPTP
ncbi:MAG: PQQ-dependent sugar dehydrogenase [Sphingomicrobium sp.]